ncbi:MAG: hypothetical protein ACE5KT_06835 [Methanosarcinales archaeon]
MIYKNTNELNDVQKAILKDLLESGYIGKKHTPIEKVQKGFPKHLRGEVKKAVKKLIRMGCIREYPTSHGIDVTIPVHAVGKIKEILGVR